MCSRWVITPSAIRVVLSAYLRLPIFLQAVWISACVSPSPAFSMMYCASELNKQGDNIQPWCSPFPNLTQFVVPRLFLTVASWPVYSSCRRQVMFFCYSQLLKNFPQFVMIHRVKGFVLCHQWSRTRCFSGITCFSMIQWMLAIWSLVSLPFGNPICNLESLGSFAVDLAWRILSINLLACEMNRVML